MSPTLLEATVVIILIIVAWQLGLALAPIVLRELHNLKQSLDDESDTNPADPDPNATTRLEERHDSRR
jgi:hypothetical protein